MDRDAYDEAMTQRHVFACEAIGMLGALVRMGVLPAHHVEQATAIVDGWDAATAKANTALSVTYRTVSTDAGGSPQSP